MLTEKITALNEVDSAPSCFGQADRFADVSDLLDGECTVVGPGTDDAGLFHCIGTYEFAGGQVTFED